MSRDLDGIGAALPDAKRAEVEIDISERMGLAPGECVLKFCEPDAAALFTVPKDAEYVRLKHTRWPDELCQSIALLALCHVEPVGKRSAGEFYMDLCERSTTIFMHVLRAFQEAFPGLRDWDAAVDEGKAG